MSFLSETKGRAEIESAERNDGRTVFDWLLGIIRKHDAVDLVLK